MSLHKNQTGFSAVEAMLLVLVTAIVGGVATYVIFKQLDTENTKPTTAVEQRKAEEPASEPEPTTTTPALNGAVVTTTDSKAQFTLPSDWSVVSKNDGGGTCGLSSTAGTCVLEAHYKPTSLATKDQSLWYTKIYKTTDSPQKWYSTQFSDCIGSETTVNYGYKYIKCGTDHVFSNGQYIAVFVTYNDVAQTAPYAGVVSQIANSIIFK